MKRAVDLTIAGSQNDFPVLKDNKVIVVLIQKQLISSLQTHGKDSAVTDVMQRSFATADADEMLHGAFRKLSKCQCHTLPVLRDGRLIGLLTMDNIGEFMRIQTALEQH